MRACPGLEASSCDRQAHEHAPVEACPSAQPHAHGMHMMIRGPPRAPDQKLENWPEESMAGSYTESNTSWRLAKVTLHKGRRKRGELGRCWSETQAQWGGAPPHRSSVQALWGRAFVATAAAPAASTSRCRRNTRACCDPASHTQSDPQSLGKET